jgi:hypothetical protein
MAVYKLLSFGDKISFIVAMLVAMVVYVVSILLLRTLTEDLLSSIPGVGRFAPVLRKWKLIKPEEE